MRARSGLLLLLGMALAVPACGGGGGATPAERTAAGVRSAPDPESAGAGSAPGDPTAVSTADSATAAAVAAPAFDEAEAWTFLKHQVALGPRVPGTEAHRRCAVWLAATLQSYGAVVERDTFSYRDPSGRVWPLENILGKMGPAGPGRILLVAHWDSRPWADMDPDPARRTQPIPGANDGASGVAVLLEVARELRGATLSRGVDILFADGEDLGHPDDREGYCRGTRRFAERGAGDYWRGIVLDMVGDADLRIPVEAYSLDTAPDVVNWIWTRARSLEPDVFVNARGPAVYDDHIPLLRAGIPTADVIDMDYPVWHTAADDLAAVSPRSLGAVGRVVLSLALNP